MRYLTLNEILTLHGRLVIRSGGALGIRDIRILESCLVQPMATFEKKELYPDLFAKASALAFFLISNHPFIDGNKRVGHAAMEILLILNGYKIESDVDTQERLILGVADGKVSRLDLEQWLREHSVKKI
ncbi:MAG: type II toxin-antitoxin system death-on-curing family toxin [Candidatus Omnitrophota bacterium]